MLPFRKICIPLLLLFCWAAPGMARDVVVIADKNTPRAEKEALLILSGFGSKKYGSKHQKKYFAQQAYDLFIPDYISRKSIDLSVENLDAFIQKHHLLEYRKVHVFAYIVGSWTINIWIEKHPVHNIATIVYDRSPIQERAPYAIVKDRAWLLKLIVGPVMEEFSRTPYPTLRDTAVQTGVLVESRATGLMRRHKKTALAMAPLRWDIEQFGETYDDGLYTWLNHDQLYSRFDVVGHEIFQFIRHGRFSDTARRKPYEGDPFCKRDNRL
ncbi:MAG: hypothetical protein IT260_10600 [Saprospiraceae bacterium]|nr:hypothetical protein [Saprospiraceae bacterium]